MNKLYKEERQNEVSVNEINMLVDTPKTKKNYKTFWGNQRCSLPTEKKWNSTDENLAENVNKIPGKAKIKKRKIVDFQDSSLHKGEEQNYCNCQTQNGKL